MSLTMERRTRVKNYIMEKIFKEQGNFVEKTSRTFGISSTTVYKYIHQLVDEGKIEKKGKGEYALRLTVDKHYTYELNKENIEEDIVYEATLKKYVEKFSDNVVKIWEYSFMEMFNNVIDHSMAGRADIYICQNALYTWVNIVDDGIGIFKKISDFYGYNSLDDAILGLFKGKLTTDKENHSGEGIFFTSKVMDHFAAISGNKAFSQANTKEMILDINMLSLSELVDKPGTIVVLALSNYSSQNLKEVFDMYSNEDGGFTITKIPMKHVCDSGYPVSRSQAKRLYFGLERFEKVILDFSGVSEMGQGFAHELFCVYARKHPEVEIQCINENSDIRRMINHVKES